MAYRGPEVLGFEEDVDDAAVADEGHDPEEEEDDAEEVADEWVDRRELGPVLVDDGHHVICSQSKSSVIDMLSHLKEVGIAGSALSESGRTAVYGVRFDTRPNFGQKHLIYTYMFKFPCLLFVNNKYVYHKNGARNNKS